MLQTCVCVCVIGVNFLLCFLFYFDPREKKRQQLLNLRCVILLFVLLFFFFNNGKVQSHPDDDKQEEDIEEANNEKWLLEHHNFGEIVFQIEVVDVIFNQVLFTECNDWTSEGIQVCVVKSVRHSLNGIWCNQFNVLASFR